MNSSNTSKWNARYAFSGEPIGAPAEVLTRGEKWLPETRAVVFDDEPHYKALDLACGRAANGRWLAQRGFSVEGWDSSTTVIEQNQKGNTQADLQFFVRDVVAEPPDEASFNVIVVSRFLERSLCPAIAAALKPGGLLFYQTFIKGLSNPNYLLKPQELLHLFDELDVLEYYEVHAPKSEKAEAMLVAKAKNISL